MEILNGDISVCHVNGLHSAFITLPLPSFAVPSRRQNNISTLGISDLKVTDTGG